MITVSSKEILFALPRKPKENELACVEDTRTIYRANKQGKWEKIKADGGLNISLYELNKNIMSQLSALNEEQETKALSLIQEFSKTATSNTYFMLLGRDINYYTIFDVSPNNGGAAPLAATVLECAKDVGSVLDVSLNESNAIEIWVKTDSDTICLMFFDYSQGVIPVKV